MKQEINYKQELFNAKIKQFIEGSYDFFGSYKTYKNHLYSAYEHHTKTLFDFYEEMHRLDFDEREVRVHLASIHKGGEDIFKEGEKNDLSENE